MKSIGKIEEISKRDVLALWYNNEEAFREAGGLYHEVAESAAYEIATEDADAYIMVDDETDKMISICAYKDLTQGQFIAKYEPNLCHDTIVDIEETGMDVLLVSYISGLGRNAAYSTMKDLMQIAKNENRIVLLQPEKPAEGFYVKLGFSYLQEKEQCHEDAIPVMIWGDI